MTAIRTNLRGNYPTQYSRHEFTSLCMFQGKQLGAGPDGLFQLGIGNRDVYTVTDDERKINAWLEFPTSTFGQDVIKRIREMSVRGEFSGKCQIVAIAKCKEETEEVYDIIPLNTDNLQHSIQVTTDHRQTAMHWVFVIRNVKGADFSIDAIDAVIIPVSRRVGL